MAVPTYVAAGAMAGGTGPGAFIPEPAGTQDGDLHILVVGTANQTAGLFSGYEVGFVALSGATAGIGTAGAADATRITIFWRIRDSGSGASGTATLDDSGAYNNGRMFAVRGQAASDFLELISTSTQSAGTAGSADGGGPTSFAENLILVCIAASGPNALEQADLSSPANGDLTSVTERFDESRDDGGGGLLALITGELAAQDSFGATTYTSATSTQKAHVVLAVTSGASGGGGDVTAPTLSNPVDTATGATTGSGSVDTNEGNGTLYFVVTQSSTSPSAAQVKAGQDHTGAAADDSGSQAVSGTGTQNISGGFTGLTAETSYFAHYMHEDAATNQSSVSTGDGFTTEAASAGATTRAGINRGLINAGLINNGLIR